MGKYDKNQKYRAVTPESSDDEGAWNVPHLLLQNPKVFYLLLLYHHLQINSIIYCVVFINFEKKNCLAKKLQSPDPIQILRILRYSIFYIILFCFNLKHITFIYITSIHI